MGTGSHPERARQQESEVRSSRSALVLLGALLAVAALLRGYRLGALSFSGDEETTALAAQALLRGWPPTLPGGLVYLRGLPFTALEALAVGAFGTDELGLRLVPALVALPRVAIAFWLARAVLPPAFSLVPAALVAVAPLDVELSRTARMYSMFMTADALFLVAAMELVRTGRGAVRASAWGAFSLVTHALTALHVPLPLLGLFRRPGPGTATPRLSRPTALRLAAVVGALAAVYLLYDALLASAYSSMGSEKVPGGPSPVGAHLLSLRAAALLTALALTGTGPFAAALRAPHLLLAAALPTLGWGLAAALAPGSDGPAARIAAAGRLLLSFPAPNWVEPVLAAPALSALVALGILVAFERAARDRTPGTWLLLVAAGVAPALLGGLVARKEALRYQAHALLPALVLATVGARQLAEALGARGRAAVATALLVAGAATRPDLALDAALRRPGPVTSPFAVLPVAPDHRGAARFLADHARPEEPVIAEDPLQIHLYLGRADYWLRRFDDAAAFVVRHPDGSLRDAYVGARLVPDLRELRRLLAASGAGSAWLVTSGEVEAAPDWYRTPDTQRALEAWRPLAWFVGEDGLSRVFRLEDGRPVPPPADREAP